MAEPAIGKITALLAKHAEGDEGAVDELVPLAYEALRSIAAVRMRAERADHTLQPTALVQELYLKLRSSDYRLLDNVRTSAHFYNAAGLAMERLLVKHAEKRGRQKNWPHVAHEGVRVKTNRVDLRDDHRLSDGGLFEDVELLTQAMAMLHQEDREYANVARMKYFCGLTLAEVATVLGVTFSTARTQVKKATLALTLLYEGLHNE